MADSKLRSSFARTLPVTYTVAGSVADECRDGFVLKHWTEPIEILVIQPTGAPYVTFSKYVDTELVVRITTPAHTINGKTVVPDAMLCWSKLDRFAARPADGDVPHLIIRDEKVFIQPRRRGSDARVGGSDARSTGGRARTGAAGAPQLGRSSTSSSGPRSSRAGIDTGRDRVQQARQLPRTSSSSSTVHRAGIPAAIARTVRAAILEHRARRDRRRPRSSSTRLDTRRDPRPPH